MIQIEKEEFRPDDAIMQYQTTATISHGDGSLISLVESLENHNGDGVTNLIIFHRDVIDFTKG